VKRDSSVTVGLRYSDIIFYGELLSADSTKETFKFKILELFKGNYSKKIINGRCINDCSIMPYDKGLWIVYAKQINDSTITLSMCSPSISMSKTEGLIPPPPLFYKNGNKTTDEINVEIQILRKRMEGLSYWFADLEKLRQYKREQTIIEKKIDLKDVLISLLILTNFILIIMVIKTRRN
jgi:hypothetical protein